MRRRLLEKRLRRELSAAAQPDFDALASRIGLRRPGRTPRRRIAWRAAVAAACLCAVCLAIALPLLRAGRSGPAGNVTTPGYLTFDINPSCSISYDENGVVTEAVGLNRDGEILLSGADLLGKTYEEASEMLFARCMDLGYFSTARQDNAVLLSATSYTGATDTEVRAEVEQTLYRQFSRNGVYGVVITSVDNPLLTEAADAYGISVQKYMLINQYRQMGGTLSSDRYDDISIRELYAGISELEEQIRQAFAEELEEATEELFEVIAEDVEEIIENIDDYLEELEDALDADDRWESAEDLLEDLEDLAERIEEANTAAECAQIIGVVRERLDGLRQVLPGIFGAVLDNALEALDRSAGLLEEYELTTQTVEEAYLQRLQSNWDTTPVFGPMTEDWLEEQVKYVSSAWYDLREQWEQDRKHDFDHDDDD